VAVTRAMHARVKRGAVTAVWVVCLDARRTVFPQDAPVLAGDRLDAEILALAERDAVLRIQGYTPATHP
jgi:hypothetical protein